MIGGLAVIVGTSPNLGVAIAKAFGGEGMHVAMIGRNRIRLRQNQEVLEGAGIRSSAHSVDVTYIDALNATLEEILDEHGAPSVLVYNAARLVPGAASQIDPSEFAGSLAVDAVGALAATQAVAPAMGDAGGGSILMTGGGMALEPNSAYTAASAGKAALRALSACLAEEYEPQGIHIALVTIRGFIAPATPARLGPIADEYLQLHREPRGTWHREVVYDAGGA